MKITLPAWINRSNTQAWLTELQDQDIDDMQAQEKRAEGPRWQSTLEKLSDGLVLTASQDILCGLSRIVKVPAVVHVGMKSPKEIVALPP